MKLKITNFGDSAQGIELSGDPKSCEPDHVRIAFPGGWVEVVRASDGKDPDYWVHIGVNHIKNGLNVPGETFNGNLADARLDIHGKHSHGIDTGEFKNPNLYHLAVRVKPDWKNKP
jgi:hypothetical protein